jgi:hypothetical protein
VQIVSVPYGTKAQGFLGRAGARRVRKETPKWERRSGGRSVVVLPTDEICALSKGMRAIGDIANARKVRDLTVPIGRDLAATLRRDYPEVIERLSS